MLPTDIPEIILLLPKLSKEKIIDNMKKIINKLKIINIFFSFISTNIPFKVVFIYKNNSIKTAKSKDFYIQKVDVIFL